MIITSIILLLAIALFVFGKPRPEIVAVFAVLALGLGGILTPQETFSGFSASAVITIISIFILTEGLRASGITERLGERLIKIGGNSESRLVLTVTLAGALLSLFMNNIAAASVLMPAINSAARRSRIAVSRLMMPLSFGTILGGMATLLTTTNILVSSILKQHGYAGFGLTDFLAVGIPIVICGTAYLALLGRRFLPGHPLRMDGSSQAEPDNLNSLYHLQERIVQGVVKPGSELANKMVRDCRLRQRFNLNLIGIQRDKQLIDTITPEIKIMAGDLLQMIGRLDQIDLAELQDLIEIESTQPGKSDLELVEFVLPPRSPLIGKTLVDAHFREKYGMNVVAIWRAGRPYRTGHQEMVLQFGDALLLEGDEQRYHILQSEPDTLVLTAISSRMDRSVAIRAGLIMMFSLITATIFHENLGELLLLGAFALLLFKVVDPDQAYKSVDWKTVFLLAGLLPLEIAINKSGLADLISQWINHIFIGTNGLVVIAGLVLITILATQVLNGAAVAAILTPVAIHLALSIGSDPRIIAMAVALGSSVAFLTPLGHPVNLLVMGLGGYKFTDYARVGWILSLLVYLIIVAWIITRVVFLH